MKNIVKYVCKELNITQKILAEEIGVSEGTVNRWSAKPEDISLQTHKTLQLLLENTQLKENIFNISIKENNLHDKLKKFKNNNEQKTIAFRISKHKAILLSDLASSYDLNVSEFVREIIDYYIENLDK
jgi:transcriptional regulator with XRE-family HTH domain